MAREVTRGDRRRGGEEEGLEALEALEVLEALEGLEVHVDSKVLQVHAELVVLEVNVEWAAPLAREGLLVLGLLGGRPGLDDWVEVEELVALREVHLDDTHEITT